MLMNKSVVFAMVILIVNAFASPLQGYSKTICRPYDETIQKTVNMIYDNQIKDELARYNLNIVDLTWEDTGRSKNSSIGPNISDMTLQVDNQYANNHTSTGYRMPVIRYENFTDVTADIPIEKIFILTGNEKGDRLKKTNLKAFLTNIRKYLSYPDSWKGGRSNLLAPRDTHVLANAQACFLPIPKNGDALFNPVLYNYQSYEGNPAVLSILATREGTSVTVIENGKESGDYSYSWGQKLYFNDDGQRAKFKGVRAADFKGDRNNAGVRSSQEAEEKGLNMVMLIQVPLKQRPMHQKDEYGFTGIVQEAAAGLCNKQLKCEDKKGRRSDVETAVISHGETVGPFTETNDLAIERDMRFPIRVTIQFYKATSNGVVASPDLKEIAKKIERVYHDADFVGSLVVDGYTARPTEHNGPAWEPFWHRHEHHPRGPCENENRIDEPSWGVLEE